ncbi:hypothetical protein J8J14_08300 [Roseomonas sp. SSH11]|uniref:Uncharacterized protein n=1 Tax=Pararoseomonas baculiformis TaxID=2820812 RepID=A0ABS4ACQ3_9PROT|nr:hypothetical protein [Pararoseomonas baculiformis]
MPGGMEGAGGQEGIQPGGTGGLAGQANPGTGCGGAQFRIHWAEAAAQAAISSGSMAIAAISPCQRAIQSAASRARSGASSEPISLDEPVFSEPFMHSPAGIPDPAPQGPGGRAWGASVAKLFRSAAWRV